MNHRDCPLPTPTPDVPPPPPQLVRWLRSVARRGGKGVVGNVDARSLGRAADLIEQLIRERDAAFKALAHYGYSCSTRCSVCGDIIVGSSVGNSVFADKPDWRHRECDAEFDRRAALKDAEAARS